MCCRFCTLGYGSTACRSALATRSAHRPMAPFHLTCKLRASRNEPLPVTPPHRSLPSVPVSACCAPRRLPRPLHAGPVLWGNCHVHTPPPGPPSPYAPPPAPHPLLPVPPTSRPLASTGCRCDTQRTAGAEMRAWGRGAGAEQGTGTRGEGRWWAWAHMRTLGNVEGWHCSGRSPLVQSVIVKVVGVHAGRLGW